MQGKALTNLAETLCWISPQTGVRYADLAVDLNEQANAPIEVGKALTAKSIALALDNPQEAINLAKKAENLQSNNGYKSGVLFALNAKGLALFSQNKIDEARDILEQISSLSSSLGNIYSYYPLILAHLILENNKMETYSVAFQWLDFDKTKSSIQSIINNFKGS